MEVQIEDLLEKINKTLRKINNVIGQPQKIDTKTPLIIELQKKEKNEKGKLLRTFFILGIVLFGVMAIISASFVLPEENDNNFKSTSTPIRYEISYPTYVAQGDQRVIELTLTNASSSAISGVKSFLIYPPELPIIITSNNGNSTASFGLLEANETKTQKIKFCLRRPSNLNQIVFKLKITSKEAPEIGKTYKIGFFPIPYIRTISFWLFTALFGIIGVIFLSIVTEITREKVRTKI